MMPLEMIRIDRSSTRGHYFPNLVMIKCFLVFYWNLYFIFPDGYGNRATEGEDSQSARTTHGQGALHTHRQNCIISKSGKSIINGKLNQVTYDAL